MNTIGGSLFIRNAIKFDFPLVESVNSLLAFCDEVAIIECQSEDSTVELLLDNFKDNPKVKMVFCHPWDVLPDYNRLPYIANAARDLLKTQWHFMLQADEVVHESSIPWIKQAVELGNADSYMVRRFNLWGSQNHYIRFDSDRKPVGDRICRLAKINLNAFGDAESLYPVNASNQYLEKIKIVHYSFIRKGSVLIDKCLDMQSWFHNGPGSQQDPRLFKHKEEGNIFDSTIYYEPRHLAHLDCGHPKYMDKWLAERKDDPTYKRIDI